MSTSPILCITEKLEQTLPPYRKPRLVVRCRQINKHKLFDILLIYLSIKKKLVKLNSNI